MVARPQVAAVIPTGWLPADIERPNIAESSGARYTQWEASRSARDDVGLVMGCVATPIPGWVEDMRPAVEGRTVALAGASASKLTGGPVDARAADDGTLVLRAASDLSGPLVGRARTFIGFDESHVLTCFVSCTATSGVPLRQEPAALAAREGVGLDVASTCASIVSGATLEGALPPPGPGVALRAATWAVHHPRPTALVGLGLVVMVGILAVVLRRRPRSRIDEPRVG